MSVHRTTQGSEGRDRPGGSALCTQRSRGEAQEKHGDLVSTGTQGRLRQGFPGQGGRCSLHSHWVSPQLMEKKCSVKMPRESARAGGRHHREVHFGRREVKHEACSAWNADSGAAESRDNTNERKGILATECSSSSGAAVPRTWWGESCKQKLMAEACIRAARSQSCHGCSLREEGRRWVAARSRGRTPAGQRGQTDPQEILTCKDDE